MPRSCWRGGSSGEPMIERGRALEEVSGGHFEVVVIGGGITGAGVALDAASRGYSVALLEGRDFAFGTSSRSSKMVHGGLRYLEQFDIGLVREALLERQLMVRLAPHLVYPTPYLVPLPVGDGKERMMSLGLNAYDVLAGVGSGKTGRSFRERRRLGRPGEAQGSWSPDRHRTIEGSEAVEMVPALADCAPESAFLFYDCQTDDVRLVLTALGEAERFGAISLNRALVTGIEPVAGGADTVFFRDGETGEEHRLTADNVVNATGVWADQIRPGEIEREEDMPKIAPSRGTHLLLPTEALDMGDAACVVPAGQDRSIFALPWYGRTLVGTTDVDYPGSLDAIQVPTDDIEYLLGAINEFFGLTLTDSDLVGAYAGVRPLISTGDPRKSVDISRRAELFETSSGMLTITGGKLTTWRRMAQQTVDRIVARAGREAPCVTAEIPLGMELDPDEIDPPSGVDRDSVTQLAFRYGHAAKKVLALAGESPEFARPVVPGRPDLMAEVVLACRQEQARSISDVLLRRTRLGVTAASSLAQRDDVEALSKVMAAELGWSASQREAEVEDWLETVLAEGLNPGGRVTAA